jgi:hypothetical protein
LLAPAIRIFIARSLSSPCRIGVTSVSGRDNEIEHRTPSGGMVLTRPEAIN